MAAARLLLVQPCGSPNSLDATRAPDSATRRLCPAQHCLTGSSRAPHTASVHRRIALAASTLVLTAW
eukprot:8148192-Lingulodinium_polyedra.AAC.1